MLAPQNQTVYLIKWYISYFNVDVLINAILLSVMHTCVAPGTAYHLPLTSKAYDLPHKKRNHYSQW